MRKKGYGRTVPVLALALGAAVFAAGKAQELPDPQSGPRVAHVLSYNIHHGTGDCVLPPGTPPPPSPPECGFDLEQIARVIRAENVDVAALQEVDRFWNRSARTDQPAILAKELEMHRCYAANLDHPPDSHSPVPHQYGTLILSRFPILDCRNTFLPSTRPATETTPEVRREQRGLLEALVNARGVPFRIYNTHLEHTSAFQDVRTAQVNRIVELVGSFEEPTALAGDLNALPTASEMQPLFALFEDAWLEGGDGGPGYTLSTHPVDPPTRRIDYVLVSPGIAVSETRVVINDTTRRASDHYPVRAELALPGSEVGIGKQ